MITAWQQLTTPFRDIIVLQRIFRMSLASPWRMLPMVRRDLDRLLAADRIRRTTTPKAFARTFTVVEKGSRRRWILWPKEFNETVRLHIFPHLPDLSSLFPTISNLHDAGANFVYHSTIDISAMFQHFPVDPEIGDFFAFTCEGISYAPTTIPTGAAPPPLFAQIFSMAMAVQITTEFVDVVYCSVFIDNFRVSSNCKDSLIRWLIKFYELAASLRVTMNETMLDAITAIDNEEHIFLGLQFKRIDNDPRTGWHSVQLGPRTTAKLLLWKPIFETTLPPTLSIQQWQSLFGILMFASHALHIPRAPYYYAFKFLRRKCTSLSPVRGWRGIQHIWRGWITTAIECIYLPMMTTKRDLPSEAFDVLRLYTDASRGTECNCVRLMDGCFYGGLILVRG